jgi:hypothetical protein
MASLSGRDTYEPLDAAQLYHEHEDDYRALPPPLSSPQDGYAHGEYAYAPHHSSGASLSGKRIALFNSSKYPSHTTSPRYLSALRISFLLYSPLPARGCNSRNAGSLVLYVVKFPPMACSEANTITQLPRDPTTATPNTRTSPSSRWLCGYKSMSFQITDRRNYPKVLFPDIFFISAPDMVLTPPPRPAIHLANHGRTPSPAPL